VCFRKSVLEKTSKPQVCSPSAARPATAVYGRARFGDLNFDRKKGEGTNEHKEELDDGGLSDCHSSIQSCRQLLAGYHHVSGEAVALKANALGISLALSDTARFRLAAGT